MVVQKCLMTSSDEQRARLGRQVVEDSLYLSQNQFGNYIIQNIIKMNDFEQNQRLLKAFAPHLITLCVQKFSSNVIEKCIENFDDITRNMLYEHLERHPVMK